MNYLSLTTLKISTYLLFGNNYIELSYFEPWEVNNFFDDICNNKMEEFFLFKPRRQFVTLNYVIYKDTYDSIVSKHQKETSKEYSSLEKIFKIFLKKLDSNIYFKDLKNISYKQFNYYPLLKDSIEIHFNNGRKDKLLKFVGTYTQEFLSNGLFSLEYNYYSFEKNIKKIVQYLDKYSIDFGNRFNITLPLNDDIKSEKIFDKRFRICESLLYLILKKHIEVNSMTISEITTLKKENFSLIKYALNINLTLNKTIDEIQDIFRYWTFYGDIRINEKDGIAYYKNYKYPFKSTKTKSFKLLCHLIKNSGKKVPVTEAYASIRPDPDNLSNKEKKKIIKDNIKIIKRNLKISTDPDPTISIMITGNDLILISNSPV